MAPSRCSSFFLRASRPNADRGSCVRDGRPASSGAAALRPCSPLPSYAMAAGMTNSRAPWALSRPLATECTEQPLGELGGDPGSQPSSMSEDLVGKSEGPHDWDQARTCRRAERDPVRRGEPGLRGLPLATEC